MRKVLFPLIISCCFLSSCIITPATSSTSTSKSYEYKDYSISIDKDDNINLSLNKNLAKPGEEVTITINSITSNYHLKSLRLYRNDDATEYNITNYKFTMPYGDCTLEAKTYTYDTYKREPGSMVSDPYFKNGMACWNLDNTNPKKEADLTYGNNRETDGSGARGSNTSYWTFCQWWCKNSINSTQCQKINGEYVYQDDTRDFRVNTNTSKVTLNFNTVNVYNSSAGESILTSGNWPHMLIEEHFPLETWQYVNDIETAGKKIYLKGEFNVSMDQEGMTDPRMLANTSTLNWYVVLTYKQKAGDPTPSQLGETSMYLGFPIYDTRYLNGIPKYDQADIGQPGATGRYVYNNPSRLYIDEYFQYNKTYKLDMDITENIKNAYNSAKNKGFLKGTSYERMCIAYMSCGWEVYSGRIINSTVRDLNVYTK